MRMLRTLGLRKERLTFLPLPSPLSVSESIAGMTCACAYVCCGSSTHSNLNLNRDKQYLLLVVVDLLALAPRGAFAAAGRVAHADNVGKAAQGRARLQCRCG